MWFFYSILSAITYGSRSIFEKNFLKSIDKYVLAFGLRFFALPFFFIPFIFNPNLFSTITSLPWQFWAATLFVAVIETPFEMIFYYKALELESVNFVVPLLSISPIFTVLVNYLVFHQLPNLLGFAGVILLVMGVYFLKVEALHEGIFKPIYYLIKNKAFQFMLLMLLSYSVGVVVDKFNVKNSNVYVYSLFNYLFLSVALFVLMMLKSRTKTIQLKANFKGLTVLGLVVAIYTIFRFSALDVGNAGYVAAVMSSSLLFTLIFSYLFLKEREIKKRILPVITIVLGLIVIGLGK